MNLIESTVSKEMKYEGRIVNIREDSVLLPDGRCAKREVCEHPGGVAILALFPDDTVLTVRQYRYPLMREMLEVPAGKLEKGEEPLKCGIRELEEETGYTAKEITPLGCVHPSPGFLNEVIYLYLAQGLLPQFRAADDDEFLEVERHSLKDLMTMIMENKITDAKTIAAVMKTCCIKGILPKLNTEQK
jgi:ADP-ribose pyrophosphatase